MTAILATVSIAIGGLIAAFNWYSIYATLRAGRHVSPVPLLGGLLLVLGLLWFPQTRPYAWLGVMADYGTLIAIIGVPAIIWEAWSTCPASLLHRFVSEGDGRRDDIRLFKRSKFTIRTEFDPPVPCDARGALAASLGHVGTWREDPDGFILEGYAGSRALQIRRDEGHYSTTEVNCPDNQEFQADRLDALKLNKVK